MVKISLYVSGWNGGASGSASWMRTRRAATPAIRKKTKVEIRYMIPIRLWSVVVSQAPMPRRRMVTGTRAGAARPERSTTGGAAVVAMGVSFRRLQLFQRLKVGDDVGRFFIGQTKVGHDRARLDCRRVQDPAFQIVGTIVRHSPTGNGIAGRNAGQIRADGAVGARYPRNGVAAGAAFLRNQHGSDGWIATARRGLGRIGWCRCPRRGCRRRSGYLRQATWGNRGVGNNWRWRRRRGRIRNGRSRCCVAGLLLLQPRLEFVRR